MKRLRSILALQCARCQSDQLYEFPPWNLARAFEMKEHCNTCGQKFMLEPGFYFGAMFLAYLVTAVILFASFAIFFFVINLGVDLSMVLSISLVLFLYVYINRLSRSIWLHMNVRYDPNSKIR